MVSFLAPNPAPPVAVAYVDPGNFATNMAGGAGYGYLLLWVILSASPPRVSPPPQLTEGGICGAAIGWLSCGDEFMRDGCRVSARFEELDWRETPLGELVLRRRWDPVVGREVHEIKLDDEFLMSSLFTVAEVELARFALAELASAPLDVVVGGLGLGYTARAVLENAAVRRMVVVDALGEVIEWHQRGLIPAGVELTADPRCHLVHGDFFAMVRSGAGFEPAVPDRLWHAIVVDIDHSPRHFLHPSHADLYRPEGLRRLGARLHPGGVFALWSNDPPDGEFTAALAETFPEARAEIVRFENPLQRREATATVYLAKTAPAQ